MTLTTRFAILVVLWLFRFYLVFFLIFVLLLFVVVGRKITDCFLEVPTVLGGVLAVRVEWTLLLYKLFNCSCVVVFLPQGGWSSAMT